MEEQHNNAAPSGNTDLKLKDNENQAQFLKVNIIKHAGSFIKMFPEPVKKMRGILQ